ncbi:MAG: hypothetical protein FJW27_03655 [Acidimicrobiia bacterium]|nr:hypothetical protein [Acidimicrobiia bacterium]
MGTTARARAGTVRATPTGRTLSCVVNDTLPSYHHHVRIVVLGSGGVGGYFGGRLAAKGVDVTFIARGAHLAAMRARGLRVDSPGGGHTASVRRCD